MDKVLNNKIDNQAREIVALQDEVTALRTDHADLEALPNFHMFVHVNTCSLKTILE